ncbi:Pescadillo N-terminus-domain-containing protein [Infundibulicybe gibba]|nr:Pescadillo N-terminus-domain-containing protein [Infundibulicybe gibba]
MAARINILLLITNTGIFPREPRSRKRANKGSSAPTSFYYAKDIAYLAHEPVLKKLREHKAFAKKLSKALGRGEWSSAKSWRIISPYPTFIDAVRDIDDALCMIFLFASLPSTSRLPPELIENCSRLAAEWQLYVMHSQSLRKVFLSIKGVYYQAEVMDQTVTWLVPYQFTQSVHTADVDVRVMLTFLELYQTLLGFKDEGAAGIGAFSLQSINHTTPIPAKPKVVEVDGHKISGRSVRQTIKNISTSTDVDADIQMSTTELNEDDMDEEFVPHASKSNPQTVASLPTLKSISTLPQSSRGSSLFSPYTFFLSRESSRPIFEFLVRSFGGRLGWPLSSGSGSPFDISDDSITHVIIDRPMTEPADETSETRDRRLRRKYVQPQWVVDCINAGAILLEEPYLQGKILPPHLSPFGESEGAYDPMRTTENQETVSESSSDEDVDIHDVDDTAVAPIMKPIIETITEDPAALRAVEIAAEAAGIEYGDFEKEVSRSQRKQKNVAGDETGDVEKDMNKMMMSNKQKKLYEKIKYSQKKRETEREGLEKRRKTLVKEKKRDET